MASFASLFYVGEVLAHLIREGLGLSPQDVLVGPALPEIDGTTKHLRITLLWTTQQPTHRNDTPQRNADGTLAPPPLSLSAFYLLSAYGQTTNGESYEAHHVLGDAMRVFHDEPEIMLPLAGLDAGQGKLGIQLSPMSLEYVEKIFGALQLQHRPFALVEVGPVQLASRKAALPARPLVMPGGIRLKGPTPRTRPVLTRAIPATQALGGRIRLDGAFADPPQYVWIGRTRIEGAGISIIDGSRSVSVAIPATPDAVSEGIHRVTLAAEDLPSNALEIEIVGADQPTLDGPLAIAHSKAQDLTLLGRALSGAIEIVAWPDSGILDPSEVKTLQIVALASDEALTVAAASLVALSERAYRFVARVGEHRYTPFVVLEITS